MHLVSVKDQDVSIPRAAFSVRFASGEAIWTESSYKYTPEDVLSLGAAGGLRSRQQWLDGDARFALTLFAAE